MLADKSFPSIEEKREYARASLIARGDWNPVMEGSFAMPYMPQAVHESSEDAAVLQPGLSKTSVGRGPKKHSDVSNLPKAIRTEKKVAGVLQSKVPLAGVASSKNRKHALKNRTCHSCLRVFTPTRKTQLFCENLCKISLSRRGNKPLEKRLKQLIPAEIKKRVPEMLKLETRCPRCWRNIRPSCQKCSGKGFLLTDLGRAVLLIVDRYRPPRR
jgi:hypothetical protein